MPQFEHGMLYQGGGITRNSSPLLSTKRFRAETARHRSHVAHIYRLVVVVDAAMARQFEELPFACQPMEQFGR